MNINYKKICIIGYTGQVGSQINQLIRSGNSKKILINSKNSKNYSFNIIKSKILKFKPSIIFNCVAYTDVNRSYENLENCLELNLFLVKNLIDISNSCDSLLIHFSSDFVFDGTKKIYYEDSKTNPLNFYGISKNISDSLIFNYAKNYLIIRTSWIYSDIKNNFVKNILSQIHIKNKIKVTDEEFGSPTSSKYLAELVMILLKKIDVNKSVIREIFNISSSSYCSRYELALEILKIYKNKKGLIKEIDIIKLKNIKTKIKRPTKAILSKKKYISYTGYKPYNWKIDLKNNINFDI